MNSIQTYLFCVLGIVISVVLPILRNSIPVNTEIREAGRSAVLEHVWIVAKPYVMVGLFSLVAALLVVAAINDPTISWRAALLAGYAWDSTLQKFKG